MAPAVRGAATGTAAGTRPAPEAGAEAARTSRLRYVSDRTPGVRRLRAGRHFRYVGPDGRPLRDREALARIRSLAIPPAWRDVWICPHPDGHIQATGRDAKGRKQYRYHPRWRRVRDETKYDHLIAFAEALPPLRRRLAEDLGLRGLPRDRVVATVVRLLETTFLRVGNEEYARTNHSYGLTTLRNEHAEVAGSGIRLRFRGKSGKDCEAAVRDRRVAQVVRRCQDLPGQELFEFVDAGGEVRAVRSEDVNDYLREAMGGPFTAKLFRTWAGTVLAYEELRRAGGWTCEAEARRNVAEAVKAVARRLGNTPAVCRRCYIHPSVLEAYLESPDGAALYAEQGPAAEEDLSPEEAAVLAFLRSPCV